MTEGGGVVVAVVGVAVVGVAVVGVAVVGVVVVGVVVVDVVAAVVVVGAALAMLLGEKQYSNMLNYNNFLTLISKAV